MAMIDFEDRTPAPPLSRGERLIVAITTILSIYGVAATIWSLLS